MERELNKLHLYNFCFFVIFEILFSFSFFFANFKNMFESKFRKISN